VRNRSGSPPTCVPHQPWLSCLEASRAHNPLSLSAIDEIIADIVLSVKGLAHTPKDDFLRSDWLAQIKDSNTVIGLADIEPGTIRVANGTTKDIQIASLL